MELITQKDRGGTTIIMEQNLDKYIFIIILLLLKITTYSQNLVKNPSFEKVKRCPSTISSFGLAIDWNNPTKATPDLYGRCSKYRVSVPKNDSGYQQPKTEDNYAGILYISALHKNLVNEDYWREYIQGTLSSELVEDKIYKISLYASLAEESNYTTSTIELSFSNKKKNSRKSNELKTNNFVILESKESISKDTWTEFTGYYKAKGNEQNFQIGNFIYSDIKALDTLDNGITVYLYIDDVKVEEFNEENYNIDNEKYSFASFVSNYAISIDNNIVFNIDNININKVNNRFYIYNSKLYKKITKKKPEYISFYIDGNEIKYHGAYWNNAFSYFLKNGKIILIDNENKFKKKAN